MEVDHEIDQAKIMISAKTKSELHTGGGSRRETLHRGALGAGGGLGTSRMGLACYMRAVAARYMRPR